MAILVGHRSVRGELTLARRCNPRPLPKAESQAQINGLRYERRVVKALIAAFQPQGLTIEHNPWFEFEDEVGYGLCVTDALVHRSDRPCLVVEVKQTYTPVAFSKLRELYLPVITKALGQPCLGLVIAKSMAPGAPKGCFTITEALAQSEPVVHWLGYGQVPI